MGFSIKTEKETGSANQCKKCGKREATGEDGLCNGCRFAKILDDMIKASKD